MNPSHRSKKFQTVNPWGESNRNEGSNRSIKSFLRNEWLAVAKGIKTIDSCLFGLDRLAMFGRRSPCSAVLVIHRERRRRDHVMRIAIRFRNVLRLASFGREMVGGTSRRRSGGTRTSMEYFNRERTFRIAVVHRARETVCALMSAYFVADDAVF